MSDQLTVLVVLAILFALVFSQVPIGLAMLGSGALGITLISGGDIAATVLAAATFNASAKYALVVVPMYVLMGCLIANSSVGAQLYRIVNAVVARLRLPGGLPATAVLSTAFFSGISGSSAADVAAFGRISVLEMTRHGYQKAYAAAVVAAAGTFAVLIPPSIAIVVYAIVAQESVGAMILAGVVPGAISALLLAMFVMVRARLASRASSGTVAAPTSIPVPAGAPATTEYVGVSETSVDVDLEGFVPGEAVIDSTKARLGDLMGVFYGLMIFLVVVGGLYGGFFTATEAGAVGALVAIVITILSARTNPRPLGSTLWSSLREAVGMTSMIFLLLIGASVFTYLVAVSGVSQSAVEWVSGLDVSPKVVVLLVLLTLLLLGTFIDGLSIMLLVIPIAAPIVTDLGVNGIWFGILCLKAVEIGLITPPVGLNVFIISGMTKQRAEKVFVQIVPFLVLDLAVTAVFFVFPDIVLWLPRAAGLTG